MRRTFLTLTILLLASLHIGCAHDVGSDEWCDDMAAKLKGDWTTNEAKEFAKSCIFKSYDDKED